MRAIHRDDGELCGYVVARGDEWHAVAVFGGLLDVAPSPEAAERIVHEVGLAALAERWLLRAPDLAEEEIVCLQEASPEGVTVAVGYYAMPGVPIRHITRRDLDAGHITLRRPT